MVRCFRKVKLRDLCVNLWVLCGKENINREERKRNRKVLKVKYYESI